MMNGSSGNKMTRSSDGCDDDALANISSSLDVLTALRQKYGLINDVEEATIITPAAASPASGKAYILRPPPTISKSSSSSIKSCHYAAALSASKSLFDDNSISSAAGTNNSSSANVINEAIHQNTTGYAEKVVEKGISHVEDKEGQSKKKKGCLESIGDGVDESIGNYFYKVGRFCSHHPKTMISICILISSVCATGMINLNIESRSQELWTAQNTLAERDEQRYLSYFPPTARFENVIVSRTNSDSNVLTKERLLDVMKMHESIETEVAYFEGENYNFTDLCMRGGGSCTNFDFTDPNQVCSCLMTSVLKVWDYNRTRLELDDNVLATINTYGERTDLESVLGEAQFDSNGTLVAAAAISISYFLEDRSYTKNGATVDPINEEWESSVFLPTVQSSIAANENSLNFAYLSSRSFSDELGKEIGGDVMYVNISYIAAFLFVGATLGSRICRKGSRWALSGAVIVLVGMATVAGFGVASLAGLLYGPVHSVLPFLILGIGVDDVFVICNAFDREREGVARASEDDKGIQDRAARALKRAGASITVTSLTDIVAFGISSSSAIPALASFCSFASINIFFLWSLAATFFTACTVIDEKRQRENRKDCLCCITRSDQGDKNEDTGSKEGIISRYFREYHAPSILSRPGKALTLIVFSLIFSFGLYGTLKLPVEDSERNFVPLDSYINDYIQDSDEFFPGTGSTLYITFEGGEDIYNSREELAALDLRLRGLSDVPPYIASPNSDLTYQNVMAELKEFLTINGEAASARGIVLGADSWPVDYEGFVSTLKFFASARGPGAKYAQDLSLSEDGTMLEAYRVKLEYVKLTKVYRGDTLDDSSRQIAALDATRELLNSWVVDLPSAFAYSANFIKIEGLKIINTELYRNVGLTIAAVGLIVLVTVANITTSFLITLNVAFCIIEILGGTFALGLVLIVYQSSILLLLSDFR